MDMHTIQKFILWAIPVLFAITLHEVAHGWVALKFGDKTALMLGRLTVNPIKHIDMVGTIIVPTILIIGFMLGSSIFGLTGSPIFFGWAKPVPVTWANLRNPKRDMAFVAIAGPAANLLMAIFWALIAKIGLLISDGNPQAGLDWSLLYIGQIGIMINLMLMLLNLIPIPPLDGSRIVSAIIPNRWNYYYSRVEVYGLIILLILLLTGTLSRILFPLLSLCWNGISQLFGLPFVF